MEYNVYPVTNELSGQMLAEGANLIVPVDNLAQKITNYVGEAEHEGTTLAGGVTIQQLADVLLDFYRYIRYAE